MSTMTTRQLLLVALAALVGLAVCDDVKLEFVQAVWRHGERSALVDLYPVSAKDWKFGGGGLGELTGKGMGELYKLGSLIRDRYIKGFKLFSHKYQSDEVYIRATDKNRTIVSANALLYGLFPPSLYDIPNVDYPFQPLTWFPGFTFVPVHVDGAGQCAATQSCACPRYDVLYSKLLTNAAFTPYLTPVVLLNRQVAPHYNVTTGADLYFDYPDAWKCQRAYFNKTMYEKLPWYNEELYLKSQTLYAPVKGFTEGNFGTLNVTINGKNMAHEVQVVRSGVLINELYDRANAKLDCAANSSCTSYLKELKFYGYSFHDNNVYAALTALGIPQLVDTLDGWPDYASGLFFEFYRNTSTNEKSFKVLYRTNDDSAINDVTHVVPICQGASLCPLTALQGLATSLKPLPDYATLCSTLTI